jgi:uncharacterized membrane protein YhfC
LLIAAYLLNVAGMIVLPLVLAFYLTRKFSLSWKLIVAGALTFIASQVLHIPVVAGLTALFNHGILPAVPEANRAIFNAVLLGLLAGIFEETARWVLFKFILKDVRTWKEGLLIGVGHGGVEALLLGVLGLVSVISMIALRNVDPATLGLPPDQLEAAIQQMDEFWSAPVYMAFLGLLERVFAITLHLALSVMVLYSVVYRKPAWFWIALLWHAFVDALVVYLLPAVGALGIEGIVGMCALISLGIVFWMRGKFTADQEADLSP